MSRNHLNHALLIAGVMVALAAASDSSAATQDRQDRRATGHDAPVAAKAEKPKATAVKTDAGATQDKAVQRAARRVAESDAEHARLRAVLHGAMNDALKQEQQRHTQRLARIDRVKTLATELADKDVGDRASTLRAKEIARHEKWLSNFHASAHVNDETSKPVSAKTEPKRK